MVQLEKKIWTTAKVDLQLVFVETFKAYHTFSLLPYNVVVVLVTVTYEILISGAKTQTGIAEIPNRRAIR